MKATYKNSFCTNNDCINYFEGMCMIAMIEKGTDIKPFDGEKTDKKCKEFKAGTFLRYVAKEEESMKSKHVRTYSSTTLKYLCKMMISELVRDKRETSFIDRISGIEDNIAIRADVKVTEYFTVEDVFDLYDKYVPKEKRLFTSEIDAYYFEGIFTIDELINKLKKNGYFEKDFWGWHSTEEEARKAFENWKLHDSQNIAYELLWGVMRIV